ncbi:DUF7573 domain-containing protein [Natronosalvus rutilus]|uniref:DUF7573 domain-containing protein n=1 Tax=Natronosalvus rutilus TaxID=2953753 RepID=A0A9E7NAJ0_9EURY|nr:hypothetical protein [Natronosalvus rutilus]UTF53851.1 hypothetical protein NGM29_00770 [Natronosalvus rutilus]
MVLGDIDLVDGRPDLTDRRRSRCVVYSGSGQDSDSGSNSGSDPAPRAALVGVRVTTIETMVWERRFGQDKQYKPRAFVSVRVTEDSRLTDYGQGEGSSASAADTAEADTEEASTEETAAAVSSDETTASSSQHAGDADESDPPPSDPDAGLSTYAWGTYTCTRCDSSVDRVWRDGDDLVCPSCKEW